MQLTTRAYFIGGGIGSLSGGAFLIRVGSMPGTQIMILEQGSVIGAVSSQFVEIPQDPVCTVEFSVRET